MAAALEPSGEAGEEGEPYIRPAVPPLNVVIMVAGTRGDVQPFIALGLKLKVHSMSTPERQLKSACLHCSALGSAKPTALQYHDKSQ